MASESTFSFPFGKLISLLNFIALFTLLPSLLKLVWPAFERNFSGPQMYLISVLSVTIFVMGTHNLIMIYIYKAKIPFFQKYRANNKLWPWEQNYENWIKQLKKTLKTMFLNLFIINPLIIGFQVLTNGFLYAKSLQDWPTPLQMLSQFAFFILVMDIIFYVSHSTLHRPSFYWIHKQHHEYSTTIMLATSYAHPLQYIFGNALAVGMGHMILARIFKVHLVSMIAWYVFVTLQTNQGHSGYNWSWSQLSFFPYKTHPDYHDFHHSNNVGNFVSMFSWMDTLMGTNKEFFKFKNKQNKAIKQK